MTHNLRPPRFPGRFSNPNDVKKILEQPQPQDINIDLSAVEKNTADTASRLTDIKNQLAEFFGTQGDYSTVAQVGGLGQLIDSEISGATGEINGTTNPFSTMSLTTPADWVGDLFPATTVCEGTISQNVFGKLFQFAPCEKLQPLREVLAWVFAMLAILDIVKITFRGQS